MSTSISVSGFNVLLSVLALLALACAVAAAAPQSMTSVRPTAGAPRHQRQRSKAACEPCVGRVRHSRKPWTETIGDNETESSETYIAGLKQVVAGALKITKQQQRTLGYCQLMFSQSGELDKQVGKIMATIADIDEDRQLSTANISQQTTDSQSQSDTLLHYQPIIQILSEVVTRSLSAERHYDVQDVNNLSGLSSLLRDKKTNSGLFPVMCKIDQALASLGQVTNRKQCWDRRRQKLTRKIMRILREKRVNLSVRCQQLSTVYTTVRRQLTRLLRDLLNA